MMDAELRPSRHGKRVKNNVDGSGKHPSGKKMKADKMGINNDEGTSSTKHSRNKLIKATNVS